MRLVYRSANQIRNADDSLVRSLLFRGRVAFKHIFQNRIVHDHVYVIVFSGKKPLLLLLLLELLTLFE